MRRGLAWLSVTTLGACVYFNAWYDANRAFDDGLDQIGRSNAAARVSFDTVIAITSRIVADHPDSKYADDAAILKTRSELHNSLWESAGESARTARSLTSDPEIESLATGLEGVARRRLGENEVADSLLTESLAGPLSPDDRALILFNRGLALQQMDHPERAVEDLSAAGELLDLTAQGRLNLALALRSVGQYRESADLSAQLLASEPTDMRSALYTHVDSLSRLAPKDVEAAVATLLEAPNVPSARAAAYHLVVGEARQYAGEIEAALVSFDAAIEAASTSTIAADASYQALKIHLGWAAEPEDVTRALEYASSARRATRTVWRRDAQRIDEVGRQFDGLMQAYASRGRSAAEALLRAAELATSDLHSPALARGLYLLYLDSAPDSPWAAKAALGALAASGYEPRQTWVEDRGEATDAELRAMLAALPATDPYRKSLTGDTPVEDSDSTYLFAERDLRRRIDEIETLLTPEVTAPAAPAPPPADTAAVESQEVPE